MLTGLAAPTGFSAAGLAVVAGFAVVGGLAEAARGLAVAFALVRVEVAAGVPTAVVRARVTFGFGVGAPDAPVGSSLAGRSLMRLAYRAPPPNARDPFSDPSRCAGGVALSADERTNLGYPARGTASVRHQTGPNDIAIPGGALHVKRTTTAGAIGLVAASALVIGIAATSLGSSPAPTPQAAISTPTPVATTAPTATSVPTSSPSPTPLPTATPVPTPLLVPAPLTGLLVTPAVAARHPIAVMIDDLGPARPQSGLSEASVVWQAPAEGGIPRYMAIFQDTLPKAIGPVRSSRYYYIAWAAEWRGDLRPLRRLAAGARDARAPRATASYVYNADEFRFSGTFHRITTKAPPHNLYTTGAKLRSDGQDPRRQGRDVQGGLDSSHPTPRSSCGRTAARSPSAIRTTRSSTPTTGPRTRTSAR